MSNNKKEKKDNSSNHQTNKYQKATLSPRQFSVYNMMLTGKKMREIEKILNVSPNTIYRDMSKIKKADWYTNAVEQVKASWGLVLSNYLANLSTGNWDTAKSALKGLGIFQENVKVKVAVDVDPRATKREIEAGEGRMDDLLKKKGVVEAEFSVVDDAPQEGVKEGQDTHDNPQKDT